MAIIYSKLREANDDENKTTSTRIFMRLDVNSDTDLERIFRKRPSEWIIMLANA